MTPLEFETRLHAINVGIWKSELTSDFPLLRSIRSEAAVRHVEILTSCSKELRQDFVQIMLARSYPKIASAGAHLAGARDYLERLEATPSATKLRLSQRRPGVPKGAFPLLLKALTPVLGPPLERDKTSQLFVAKAGNASVRVQVCTLGKLNELCYMIHVDAPERVGWGLSPLRDLGIAGLTMWDLLTPEDLPALGGTVTDQCARYLNIVADICGPT